jgi:hypothetical protein
MSGLIPKLRFLMILLAVPALGQSISVRVPSDVSAGSPFSVATTGSGSGTLYLLGPNHVLKQAVQFGRDLPISGADIPASGMYQVVACDSSGCTNTEFYVGPAAPARISFLVHPSRVPVSAPNAINAIALVLDRFQDTILVPTPVEFRFSSPGTAPYSRTQTTNRGIAWLEMGSQKKQGPLQVVASVGDITEPRVIQQVASEACGLRMSATSNSRNVRVQTDPIRDCSGNPLPDGTIVSFTKIDQSGRSTVDTPIKKGTATAQFSVSGPAQISLACGVVLGNEISVGSGRP